MKIITFVLIMHTITHFNNNLISFGMNLIHGDLFINAAMISIAELSALFWTLLSSS